MKVCRRCCLPKESDDFNKCAANKDGLHSYCRECSKSHYEENSDRHKKNVAAAKIRNREAARLLVLEAFSAGCKDCSTMDIRVLEFDHVRGIKKGNVSDLMHMGRTPAVIREEIDKCDVRCSNCHKIVTLERQGGSWHDQFS